MLVTALEEGFDLASGLHNLLRNEEDLAAVARATGRALHDVRVPEVEYPHRERRPAKRASAALRSARTVPWARCTPRLPWMRR